MPMQTYDGGHNPYAAPGAGEDRPLRDDPERSRNLVKNGVIAAIFLGIMPVVSFILGLITWSRAKSDLRMMELGRMSTADGARGKTKAGLILAKISTIVSPFALITLIFYVWVVIESR